MKIFNGLDQYPKHPDGCIVTVGNFDGLHLGHQAIIAWGRELARAQGLPLVAMTFDPAPVRLLCPEKSPGLLTPLCIKTKLLEELGVDELLVIQTTREFLRMTPSQFAKWILAERLGAKHMVEGETFSFGRGTEGSVDGLRSLGQQYGFEVHVVAPRQANLGHDEPVPISSTLVRSYFAASQFELTRQCLGRYLPLAGQIVSGRGLGRELGFPTANLQRYSTDQLVPRDGVFAGLATLGDTLDQAWSSNEGHPAAISIGRCQTFADGAWQIEAYLLDYGKAYSDLYHQHMLLTPIARIRDQQRFDSADALSAAMEHDCRTIRQLIDDKGLMQ